MRPGRAADHSPPSSAAVMEEYSYTSTHPLGHTGPVMGSLYLYLCLRNVHIPWDKTVLGLLSKFLQNLEGDIVKGMSQVDSETC